MNETQVRHACRELARKLGWTVIPIPNARRADSVGGQMKGASDDIMVASRRRVIFVEYKAPKTGKLSEYQKAFGVLLTKLGHSYAVVTSADELKAVLEVA